MSTDLELGLAQLAKELPAKKKAMEYAFNTQNEIFATQRQARRLQRDSLRDSYRTNFCRTVITAVTDRIVIKAVAANETKADLALHVIMDENHWDLTFADVIEQASEAGDAYVLVWPDDSGVPQWSIRSSLCTTIVYERNHPHVKKFAIDQYNIPGEKDQVRTRVDIYYPDRVERFVADDEGAEDAAAYEEWYGEEGDEESVVENPGDGVPVFHYRTGRPYGRPEHYLGYGAQDALNRINADQMATMTVAAWPTRYAITETALSTGFDDDEDDEDADVDVRVANPGDITKLSGVKSVGQFDVAHPEQFLDPAKYHLQSMATACSTPLHLFEGMSDVPSGESLRATEAPLNKKVLKRHASYGATLKDQSEYSLSLVGIDADVMVSFDNPATFDETELTAVAKDQLALGVPWAEVMTGTLGYEAEQVATWPVPAAYQPKAVSTPAPDPTLDGRPEVDQPTEEITS